MSLWSNTDMRSSISCSFTISSTCSYSSHMSSVGSTIDRLARVTRKCTCKTVFRANDCILASIIVSSNFQIIRKLVVIKIIKTNMCIIDASIDNSNRNTFTINAMIIPDIIDSHSGHSSSHVRFSFPDII